MISNWKTTTLGDIMTLQRGFDLPSDKRKKGNIPVIASNGVVGFHDQFKAKAPGVVIGRSGSIGGGQYVNTDFWPLNTTLWVKDFKGNIPKFCYFLLKTIDLTSYNAGSGVPTLNRNHIHPLEVILPPIEEQKAIAHILGTLDDKIELNNKMNHTLELMAKAIFKSWFVDFDPVRAKMEGRDTGLPAEIADLFPDKLVESELGEIPEGWRISTVGTEIKVSGGGTPNTKEPSLWENGHINWATPKDLSNLTSPILLDTERKITEAGLQSISSNLLPIGTVLLSSRAPIGYIAISEIPTAINQGFIAMTSDGDLSNYFILLWAKMNLDIIKGNANGTTFQEISKTNFRPIKIIVPDKKTVEIFTKLVQSYFLKLKNILLESEKLIDLRDSLLAKLLSGQIRIQEVEKILEKSL